LIDGVDYFGVKVRLLICESYTNAAEVLVKSNCNFEWRSAGIDYNSKFEKI
jgi:hypothetical protein